MAKLTIDNRQVEVPPGRTLLEAAATLGIEIPTLCHDASLPPAGSCMVCVVKVRGQSGLTPACATPAEDGMVVQSETDEVRLARRAALELLLSDHLGDCMGPCQVVCPAGMNIPLMIRQIAAGLFAQAIVTVKRHIALPAVLGRICPAPCEKGCRRKNLDAPVSICLLKRIVADMDLARGRPYLPAVAAPSGGRVAVVGAGPAGLAAAYYLLQLGHACVVFDRRDAPGGGLRYGVDPAELPRDVLDAEIAVIAELGAEFRMGVAVTSHEELARRFDAVLLATGAGGAGESTSAELRETSGGPCFAAGNVVHPKNALAVRSVADGRRAAIAIDGYLRGLEADEAERPFNTRIGSLTEAELRELLRRASPDGRVEPARGRAAGMTEAEARAEARRCLHCDCRKADVCKLRRHCRAYGARPRRYPSPRRRLQFHDRHASVIYEPGKCIACGLCVRISARAGEPLGLTFINRGFDVRVGVPFDGTLGEGLRKVAAECVAACPTGALSMKNACPDERPPRAD